MNVTFFLKKLITQLIIPPFNLLIVIIVGLLIAKRWPRLARACIWIPTLCLLLLSTPAVSKLLLQAVNTANPLDLRETGTAQAIVVLGGGLRQNTPEYGDTPNRYTLDRIRYGATVARATHLPILVTGGAVIGQTPEAEAMARSLKDDFAVAVRWIESQALDTDDNLKFSAAMLKAENVSTVILVTHDFHMRRAMKHCEAARLQCIAAPVSLTSHAAQSSWVFALPNADALETSSLAIHEMIGNLALLLR